MKKFFMIALAITILFVLVACKSANDEEFRTFSQLEAAYGRIANTNTADYSDDNCSADGENDDNCSADGENEDNCSADGENEDNCSADGENEDDWSADGENEDDDTAGNSDVNDTPAYAVRLVPNMNAPVSAFEASMKVNSLLVEESVAAYRNGEWDGTFTVRDGHCLSIDIAGNLWLDCQEVWNCVPDFPDAVNTTAIAKRAEGTYAIWRNHEYDWETVVLYSRGHQVAQFEGGVFALYSVSEQGGYVKVDDEWYIPRVGFSFNGETLGVYLIPQQEPELDVDVDLDMDLLRKIQNLYFEGFLEKNFETPCYEIFTNGEYYFVAYDAYSHELTVNNIVYDVNLDVPVSCKKFIGDWGISSKYAILYDMGEVRKVLTMPAEVESLVTATDDSIIFVDTANTLWHVSEKATLKVATSVCDTAGVNGFVGYLRSNGTVFTYSVWDDAGSTKLCANATAVDYYGDYGFGAVVTNEESSNTVRDGKLLYLEHTWED